MSRLSEAMSDFRLAVWEHMDAAKRVDEMAVVLNAEILDARDAGQIPAQMAEEMRMTEKAVGFWTDALVAGRARWPKSGIQAPTYNALRFSQAAAEFPDDTTEAAA